MSCNAVDVAMQGEAAGGLAAAGVALNALLLLLLLCFLSISSPHTVPRTS